MAKQVYQYRIGMSNSNMTLDDLVTGLTLPICQLSIETLPGISFLMNKEEITIGATGIYEVSFDTISTLSLTEDSKDLLEDGIKRCAVQGIPNDIYRILINIVYNE